MNLGSLFHRFAAPMLALGIAASTLALSPPSASAQEIIMTAPFSFSVDNQQYPAGTYQFTVMPEWLLSIRDAGGKERLFAIRPEGRRRSGSRSDVTFCKCEGHHELLAVYIPRTNMTVELIGPKKAENKAHISRASVNCLPERAGS